MFYNEQVLNRLKHTASSFERCKTAFASFQEVLRRFVAGHPELGLAIASETGRCTRLIYLDHVLKIVIDLITNPPMRAAIKMIWIEPDEDPVRQTEIASVYIDRFGNATTNGQQQSPFDNVP